jgi:hypothetical protein
LLISKDKHFSLHVLAFCKKSLKKVLYIESAKRPHLGEIRENLDATNGSEIRERTDPFAFERYEDPIWAWTRATNTIDPDDLHGCT